METKLEYRSYQVWICTIPEHAHIKQSAAERCIRLHGSDSRGFARQERMKQARADRKAAWQLFLQGYTRKQIAEKIGRKHSWVLHTIHHYLWTVEWVCWSIDDESDRVKKYLQQDRYPLTLDEVEKMYLMKPEFYEDSRKDHFSGSWVNKPYPGPVNFEAFRANQA